MLLDEATSALDAESELQVQQALDTLIARGGMTARRGSARCMLPAEAIITSDRGEIVECYRILPLSMRLCLVQNIHHQRER